MKHLFYFALSLMLSFGFVACSDDDGDNGGGSTTKEYVESSVVFEHKYMGAFYELVDLSVEVFINETKTTDVDITESEGLINIDFGTVAPSSIITVNVNADRNDTAIDSEKTYNREITSKFVVKRHFSDNSTDDGGSYNANENQTGLDHTKLEEYISSYADKSYSITLTADGKIDM